ncbi:MULTISPECIES: alpha/beta hydrolase [Mycolicibacterium]|uniref:Lysophospholipase n=3 Tax=Mycolicibacterium TaxID=1866885 RepID=A0A378V2W3_MYCFO|nr:MULTISPECIES: alpha/beta hydrolase [Mycolicibacterium]MBP3082228.1 alpha/beta hydrolase [Mycolicibacterium fortuitum]MCV7337413.1 alpha/beta hydrolase [Mycolicibacterium senegalense]MCW1823680.1 alpha/beta hydrolase [Mycolicibacterium senegalense]MDR7287948.1 pimeloyl-ACP methyl ester carboxylesterase [Mycolicibacterium senegalense]NOQ58646.1 alpha/beta hydrolase [Mycolicibacterium fortuitum]
MTDTRTPVVFIHGLWLHASSWQPWMDLFSQKGYAPVAPGWPGEPNTIQAARANADAVAGVGIDQVTEHYARVIAAQPQAPVIIGHSFGGLIAQKLAGLGYGRAAVAIDPAQIKGVKPLPFAQLRSGSPVLSNPANKKRAVSLTAKQFRYGFGNAIDKEASDALYERWTIPSPGRPLFEAAFANFHKDSPAKVDTSNTQRGPLLLISGQKDHTVPDVVTRAAYKLYGDSTAVTNLKQFPDRGHSLVIDEGWQEIADYVLGWLAAQRIQPNNDPAYRR